MSINTFITVCQLQWQLEKRSCSSKALGEMLLLKISVLVLFPQLTSYTTTAKSAISKSTHFLQRFYQPGDFIIAGIIPQSILQSKVAPFHKQPSHDPANERL